MTVRTIRWATGCVAILSVALIAAGLALSYVDRHLVPNSGWDFPNAFEEITFMAVPVVGFVLASRRPGNRIGWIFVGAGALLGLGFFCDRYGPRGLIAAPGSLPGARAAAWFYNTAFVVAAAGLAFMLLLFPTGRLSSRRWRPAAWFVAAVIALQTAAYVVRACRVWTDPYTAPGHGWYPGSHTAIVILWPAAMLVAVAAIVIRFARSSGEERLQLKWVVTAVVLVVAVIIPLALTPQVALSPAVASPAVATLKVLFCLAVLFFYAAIAIAVLKYRLYEIDIVISKAVQYGTLAVFITAVYAGLVAGVGSLVGNRHSLLLSALAAIVVAVAFQPVRQRAARLANRVVYGTRASPYQVLSEFARRIGGGYAPGVLPQMASIVTAGTGAERVVVWLRVGTELRAEAASDGSTADPLPVDGHEMPGLPDTDFSAPVVYQGELLGAISIRMPRNEPLNPTAEQLVTDVASQAGLALSNASLIEDLRASRQRLVAAQDVARRRLERNLHDGAQQDLVALAIKLRLAGTLVDEDLNQAKEIIGELQSDAAGALQNLRDLARGIYPPLLADLGLVAALDAQASKSAVPVVIEADGVGRFGQDIEAAVYFCCLEALQNVAKYAMASQIRIRLEASQDTLCCAVSDDGHGYDTSSTPLGSGQRNMADRLAALDGRLTVRSAPGQGTTITAQLPLASVPLPSRLRVRAPQRRSRPARAWPASAE